MTNLLTLAQCRSAARSAGFGTATHPVLRTGPDRAIAAIAMCEGVTDASAAATIRDQIPYSDFDAVGDQELITSYWWYSFSGLQIRSVRGEKGTGKTRDQLRLPEPAFAFRSALTIIDETRIQRLRQGYPVEQATGFEAWSTFLSGMWKAYLQDVFPPPDNVHVVLAGQTLGRIATLTGIGTWADWARVNALHSPYTIFIGQNLQKPWWIYTVKPGDTLTAIHAAVTEGITLTELIAFNRAVLPNPNQLAVGLKLRIPNARL